MCSPKTQARVSRISKRTAKVGITDLRLEILQTRTEYRILANSGPSLEKKGSSLEILQSQARFLQTRDEFGNSPISDIFSPNLGLRSEILQTQFRRTTTVRSKRYFMPVWSEEEVLNHWKAGGILQIWRFSELGPVFSKIGVSLEILQKL